MIFKEQIAERYSSVFGDAPTHIVRSPGRINIIGEHTDYNEGFVLPTAIDKAIYVGVGKRNDAVIRLYAEDFEEYFEVALADIRPVDKGWPNYVLGVVNQLVLRGEAVGGFDMYIDGDVPLGAGLSSSAALECAAGFALNVLFDLEIDRVDIAKIGQLAEHTYAGVKCGIMDQFASVMSKAGHVVKLDCRDLSFSYKPLELGDYAILLLNTNVKHSLASTAYNDRRASCEEGVRLVQQHFPEVNSLRDVTLDMLEAHVKPVDLDMYTKCRFVVEENERLNRACDALEQGDLDRLGEQLFRAHEGLSKEYEVSCPELDFLVDYVKAFPEVIGARMMGGGFGGCTINLVKNSFQDLLVERLTPIYKERFNLDLTAIKVVPSNGTELL
ncbi:galactokinase [Sphingobacterium sp. FBM7-1]|uniref:galactokinase n=1 Tax=Sphingobacterium sp. FBM7-1 TaxID=2886688 RepID=UPI001D0FEE75|nr:galactokinase [Sphingobacterium sp. FBM7-1]MCC2598794.1 galactokinase [Sphingobacterium sp. FBM7-1]